MLSQPKMEVKNPKHNFGYVKRGALVSHKFEIENTGNSPLVISNAEVACSCTIVDFPKNPVIPGHKEIITVNFNTTSVWGRQDRLVYIVSNDPHSPSKLRFKAQVSFE
jgi:hypothetical protein